jgi:hypothetical protein
MNASIQKNIASEPDDDASAPPFEPVLAKFVFATNH